MSELAGKSTQPGVPGVRGDSSQFNGVLGVTTANGHAGVAGVADEGAGAGVYGRSKNSNGIIGFSSAKGHSGVAGVNDDGEGTGVYGRSKVGAGVYGISAGFNGVLGETTADGHSGVAGVADQSNSHGVYGRSKNGAGVVGTSTKWVGVYGETVGIENGPAGVWGEHKGAGVGVKAVSKDGVALFAVSAGGGAILAETQSPSSAALVAKNAHGQNAAIFEGNVVVTGDITLPNADCAEDFDIVHPEHADPGTVMVFGVDGALTRSEAAYDRRVAGVVSGAGAYRPALRLDRHGGTADNRRPIALVGKVYCKVDASYGKVNVGDPLTTSPTAGHAMKADDPLKALGAVLGKALQPLNEGCGLIPVLVSLQ